MRFLVALLLVGAALFSAPLAQAALEPVGAFDPGTPGLNASVVALDGVAYLGSWGSTANCPGHGVRVIDITRPEQPSLLSAAAAYPRSTAEHLAVFRHLSG